MDINGEGVKAFFQDTTVAGIVGSLASLRFVPGVTWPARFSILVIGASVSFYALPPAIAWFGVTSQGGCALAAATAGFLGYNMLAKLTKYAEETSLPDLITNLINVFRRSPP